MKNIVCAFMMICVAGCSGSGGSSVMTSNPSPDNNNTGGSVSDGGSVNVAPTAGSSGHGSAPQGGSAPVIVPTVCAMANDDCSSNACCAGAVCIKNEKGVDCADLCSSNADCASGCCANVPANGTEPSHNVCSPINYCAAHTCNSALVGQWSEVTDGTAFDFAANGGFGFAEGVCQGGGTFTCPGSGNTGTVQMTITKSTNSSGCIGVGVYTCQFSIIGNAMSYNCGGTVLNFTRYN